MTWLVALARAADADAVQTRDGGEFVMLQEATAGAPWVPSVAISAGRATHLVVERTPDGAGRSLLDSADVVAIGASVYIARVARVGVFLPMYPLIVYEGRQTTEIGDVSFWAQLPLYLSSTWSISGFGEVTAPTGPSEVYLGDAYGSVRAALAAGYRWDRWSALANLGFKFTGDEALPGLNWGPRVDLGLGLRRAVLGPVGVGVEWSTSAPLSGGLQAGSLPMEALGTVGLSSTNGWGARVGGGAGLSHGFGSPSARLMVVGEFQRVEPPDADGDRVHDAEDACVSVPEDRDRLLDDDGCPEDDADQDGYADEVDACPLSAETENEWQDSDGCPDALIRLLVSVASTDPTRPLETALIEVDDVHPEDVLGDDPVEVLLSPGPHRIVASAEGYDSAERIVRVSGDGELRLELTPTVFGEAKVRLVDPTGLPLAGTLRDKDERLLRVPTEGLDLRLRVGPHDLRAYTPGYIVESFVLTVPTGEQVVTLKPSPVHRTGARIAVGDTLFFTPDSSRLDPGALAALEAIARMLRDDPGIQELRIEGHADETGTSAHNLLLSRTRAAAVLEWLVAAGIDRDRLEAIGSGEAALAADGGATRTVEFLILSWVEQ